MVFVGSGMWALALMHGTGGVKAQAPAVPYVIKAHKIELVNSKGKVDAMLVPSSDHSVHGVPGVTVCDSDGNPKSALNVDKDGPWLCLFDANGNPRAELDVDKDGPGLALNDANGKPRAWLSVDKDGPRLALYDENENTRGKFGVAHTVNKTTGASTTTSPGTITLYDDKGKVLYQKP